MTKKEYIHFRALVFKPYDMNAMTPDVHDYINHLRLAVLDLAGEVNRIQQVKNGK